MKCICLRVTCGNEWESRGRKRPKECPNCHSRIWYKDAHQPKVIDIERIDMKCTKCGKAFEDGETIYRAQSGTNVGGTFQFKAKEEQGLYCNDCMVAPKVLPFLGGDK